MVWKSMDVRNTFLTSIDFQTMFIAAAYYLNDVETVDLSGIGSGVDCPTGLNSVSISPRSGIVGAIHALKPVICGGYEPNIWHNDCHQYNSETNSWEAFVSMNHTREFAQSIQLDKNSFWITGSVHLKIRKHM